MQKSFTHLVTHLSLWICVVATATSCSSNAGTSGGGAYDYSDSINFLDDLTSNQSPGEDLRSFTFVDVDGKSSTPEELAPGKRIVLVVTRGNTDPICPYCTTQTSRLIANYDQFKSRGAEVMVVYPIEHQDDAQRLDAFLERSRGMLADPAREVPFPILLDVELKAVDKLGIRQDLSKPATYILDADGSVRFAYVGARLNDRPSIAAMIKELDAAAKN